jgi:hypothetical protein
MSGHGLWCGCFWTLRPKLKAWLMMLIPLPVKLTTACAAAVETRVYKMGHGEILATCSYAMSAMYSCVLRSQLFATSRMGHD